MANLFFDMVLAAVGYHLRDRIFGTLLPGNAATLNISARILRTILKLD
jgi:hypothetical protein